MSSFESFYLHFPFCETKCHYCDFYSIASSRARSNDPDRFQTALARELERFLPDSFEAKTVFFGGGTPSMTDPEAMATALDPFLSRARFSSDLEWTLEANPSSIDLKRMESYRVLGANRVSMGVQSMDDDLLKTLGRVHGRKDALRALSDVFEAGFENVSVDLLCGVPGQSLVHLEQAMEVFTRFPIRHLSCYILTLPPHHRMYKELPDEDTQLEHYLFVDRYMREQGFEHYEISNFAKPGFEARHNLRYWKGDSYLSFGPSAHSYDASLSRRWKNVSSLHKYAESLEKGESPLEWEEFLSEEQKRLEKWMLGTRLSEGFPLEWVESDAQASAFKRLESEGLVETVPGQARARLTVRGFALSEQIVRMMIS